tara:strand:- start:2347 stop:2529 length:183 start_codon:yes stop_codon:yes gene_type:complete
LVETPVAFFTTAHNRAGLNPAKLRHERMSRNRWISDVHYKATSFGCVPTLPGAVWSQRLS